MAQFRRPVRTFDKNWWIALGLTALLVGVMGAVFVVETIRTGGPQRAASRRRLWTV